jgi:hypothetical protein
VALKGSRSIQTADALAREINRLTKPDILLEPASENIRCRHVIKDGRHFYLLFNEESTPVEATIEIPVKGARQWLNPFTAEASSAPADEPVVFKPHEMKILTVPETH